MTLDHTLIDPAKSPKYLQSIYDYVKFANKHQAGWEKDYPLQWWVMDIAPESNLPQCGILGRRYGLITGAPLQTLRNRKHWTRRHKEVSLSAKDMIPSPETWQAYVKDGRCIFDRSHVWTNNPARFTFTPSGKSRTCNWCGLKQKLKEKTIPARIETYWE